MKFDAPTKDDLKKEGLWREVICPKCLGVGDDGGGDGTCELCKNNGSMEVWSVSEEI